MKKKFSRLSVEKFLDYAQYTGPRLPRQWFVKVLQTVITLHPVLAAVPISLAIVGEAKMKRLNGLYHGSFKVTDVLSFGYGLSFAPEGGGVEIIICYQQAVRQAKQAGTLVKLELELLFIHGLLHAAGFNDDTLRHIKIMRTKEAELMSCLKNSHSRD